MSTQESNTSELVAGNSPKKLLDFRWEVRETLLNTESNLTKVNLLIGEFLCMNTWNENIRKFRCLVPADMSETIAREVEQAITLLKEVKDTVN